MAISAKEIAKQLNISAATVSMVLNNKPGISEGTRSKVIEAALSLGYDLSKKTEPQTTKGNIRFIIYKKSGAIVTDTPFFSQLTAGIDIGCKQYGYDLQISYFYKNENQEEQLKTLLDNNCCGILLLGTEMEEADFEPFSKLAQPLVVLDTYFEGIECDCVLINNVQGAYLATKYLIDHGHKNVGYLKSSFSIGNFLERSDGYFKALRMNDLKTSHPYVIALPPSLEGAYEEMKHYLESNHPLASSYFADNDLIAAGAIRAFKEKGYRMPEDVSVIGFDNMPICDFIEPPLSTMHVPKEKLGILAVERLDSKINQSGEESIKIELSTRLIERKSVRFEFGE